MRPDAPRAAGRPSVSDPESDLVRRVLSTLLREDAYGLRSRARAERRSDGDWLYLPLGDGGTVALPVGPDGFQCEIQVRRPVIEVRPAPGTDPEADPDRPASAQPRHTPEASHDHPVDANPGRMPEANRGRVTGARGGGEPDDASGAAGGCQATVRAAARGAAGTGSPPRAARPAGPDPSGRGDGDVPGGERGGAPATGTALVTGLDAVGWLRRAAPPAYRDRFDAFTAECRQALATARLHADSRAAVWGRLVASYGDQPARQWTGLAGSLAYDTLAARRDHPVYPTGLARSGLGEAELRAYAPEFHPDFRLRWVAVPGEALVGPADLLPAWWPTPGALGMPELDATHRTLPVHPLTVGPTLDTALRECGLDGAARLADPAWLSVRPTLSMRTVAPDPDPGTHLKLPLATATLGLLNSRSIKPGTLLDGEVAQRLQQALTAREPRLAEALLLADERAHLDAGHPYLAALVRRYPPGLQDAQVVPLAALLAPVPGGAPVRDGRRVPRGDSVPGAAPPRGGGGAGGGGRLVIDALADRYADGDLRALFDAYLTLLFDVHTTLFSYGVALESHQQNTALVLDLHGGRPRLRLLLRDHDGPRVHRHRLAGVLGAAEAGALCGFDDRRILAGGDGPVADVFATITVHLCAGALAFELARLGRAPLDALLRQVHDRLAESVDRLAGRPGAPAAVLRARVLDADRLPVKAMVTAGSLLPKERSGAADINKFYLTGPNYLRPGAI